MQRSKEGSSGGMKLPDSLLLVLSFGPQPRRQQVDDLIREVGRAVVGLRQNVDVGLPLGQTPSMPFSNQEGTESEHRRHWRLPPVKGPQRMDKDRTKAKGVFFSECERNTMA